MLRTDRCAFRVSFRQAFYSTPQQYTEAKHASGVRLSVKKDDFFPYADCPVSKAGVLQDAPFSRVYVVNLNLFYSWLSGLVP